MFTHSDSALSLSTLQARHSVGARIALVLLAFFSAAWSLLQWTLATEPRFMAEGITRQFVEIEAMACAAAASIAAMIMVFHAVSWLAAYVRARRLQDGVARRLMAQRAGAYV